MAKTLASQAKPFTFAILQQLIGHLNLPDELVEHIGSFLGDVKLVSLGQVSRPLHNLTNQALYQSIELHFIDIEKAAPVNLNLSVAHLLLRSLLINRHLCPYVKSLSLSGHILSNFVHGKPRDDFYASLVKPSVEYSWPEPEADASVFNQSEWASFVEVQSALGSRFGLSSKTGSGRLYWRDILNALMVCLDDLQELQVGCYFSWLFDLDRILSVQSFNNLATFRYKMDIEKWENCISSGDHGYLDTMLATPSMRRLEVSLPVIDLSRLSTVQPSTLQNLTLYRTHLPTKQLVHLLAATPCLRSLNCTFSYEELQAYWARQAAEDLLDCNHLKKALDKVKHSLQELVLSVTWVYNNYLGNNWHEMPGFGTMGGLLDLREMATLHRLDLPYIMLLGWRPGPTKKISLGDVLPDSLTSLTLTDMMEEQNDYPHESPGWPDHILMPILEDFLPIFAQKGLVANQNTLHLNLIRAEWAWLEPQRRKMEEMSNTYRVKVTVTKTEEDSEPW